MTTIAPKMRSLCPSGKSLNASIVLRGDVGTGTKHLFHTRLWCAHEFRMMVSCSSQLARGDRFLIFVI